VSRGVAGEGQALHVHVLAAARAHPAWASTLVVGSSMHAAGHALLAAGAGLLARGLAAGHAPMDERSIPLARWLPASAGVGEWALVLAIFGVFAAVLKLVGGALASWAEARVAGEVAGQVRLAVLDHVLALNDVHTPRHDDHGSNASARIGTRADRLAALTSHVADVERGAAQGVLAEARAAAQLLPLAALLVALAPRLAGSAVLALAGFGALAFGLRRAFRRAHERAAASSAALVHAADEAVEHAELWATYGAERRIRAHVVRLGQAIAREAARLRVRASLMSSTSEVLGALALLLALLLAARGSLGVDHATVAPFAIAFFMAYRPLRELVDARLARARGDAALRAALGASSARARGRAAVRLATPSRWSLEALTLAGVRTMYGAPASLDAIIPPGAIAAIVGPTGSGKTTLLRALLGLEPLRAGEVRYGGRSLEGAGVGPGDRPFAWVPQDAPVVGDSLAVNVGLGRPDEATLDPARVLGELGNDGLVATLGSEPLGTVRPLSGGERQWIAVARALATGLPVLLLDEPTSALDPGSQARLIESLARLRGKRTVLLVTHRPEPLAIADLVLRLAPDRNGA
jgi:ABC-type multidrug transport system fused ATPase/permease subunit